MTAADGPGVDPAMLALRDWAPRSQVRADEHLVSAPRSVASTCTTTSAAGWPKTAAG